MREIANPNKGRRLTLCANAERGFTLVEVMVTLVILAFGLLASIVGIMTAQDHGLMNEMRYEAIKIAQEQQEQVRNMAYANIPALPAVTAAGGITIARQIRKTTVNYTVSCGLGAPQAATSGSSARMVTFTVNWRYKNKLPVPPYTYVLQTIVRQTR